MNPSDCRDELTCWRAIVADWRAGAAPVLVGGLRRQAQRAAASSHVVHVIISLIHEGGGGEAGVDPRLVGSRAGQHSRGVHLVRSLPQWHHLEQSFKTGSLMRKWVASAGLTLACDREFQAGRKECSALQRCCVHFETKKTENKKIHLIKLMQKTKCTGYGVLRLV